MAALTLLQLVQEFSRRRGLPVPSQVVGSQDDTTQQIWGLCNEGITELCDRYEWQFTRVRYTFAHAGSTNYTALDLSDTGPIPDYKAMLNRTLWDGLARREVIGPLAPKEWEVLLNLNISQAVYQYTIMGNALRIYPQPAVLTADQFRMEYISKYGVYDPIQAANTEFYEADTSVCLFPSSLMLADLKWRWGMTKGLPYAEDMRMFEGMVANLQGRDPAPDIVMDADRFTQVAAPGLLVAAGSWNLP